MAEKAADVTEVRASSVYKASEKYLASGTASSGAITINKTDIPAGWSAKVGWVYFGANSWEIRESALGLVDLKAGEVIPDESTKPSSFNPGFSVVSTEICIRIRDAKGNTQYLKSGSVFPINQQYYQFTYNLTNNNEMNAEVKPFSLNPGTPATTDKILGPGMNYGIIANEMTITGHMETTIATKELKNATGVNGPITTGSGGYSYIGAYTGSNFKMGGGTDNDTTSPMVIYTTPEVEAELKKQKPGGDYVTDNVRLDTGTYSKEDMENYVDGLMSFVTNSSGKLVSETNQFDVTNCVERDPGGKTVRYINIQGLTGGAAGTYYLQFDPGEYDASYSEAIYNLGPGQNLVLNIPDTNVELQKYFIYRNGVGYNLKDPTKTKNQPSDDGSSNGYSDYHAQTMTYNCPNATTVKTAGPFDGTVIAPKATYNNVSVASGWLVVNNFKSNSSEWHLMYSGLPRTDGGNLAIQKTFAGSISASNLTAAQKSDIKFTITGPNSYSKAISYDNFVNGKYTLSGITPGDYTVTETGKANITGYTLAVTGEGKVKVETGKTTTTTITNTYSPSTPTPNPGVDVKLQVKKVVSGTGYTANEDFSFTLADANASGKTGYTMPSAADQKKTVQNGATATFGDITFTAADTYYFTITEKAGNTQGMSYDTAAKYAKVVVDANMNATVTYGTSQSSCSAASLTVTNTYSKPLNTATLKISKLDLAGNEIDGAQMKISGTETGASAPITDITWPSVKNSPKSVTLKPGSYVLSEMSAPSGYKVITDVTFTVDSTGKVTVGQTTTTGSVVFKTDGTVEVTDDYEEQTITFKKTDIVGSKEIGGADLKITGKVNGAKSNISPITWTSVDKQSKDIQLKPGKYTLEEDVAPSGYEVITKVDFEVKVDGTIVVTKSMTSGDVVASGKTVTIKDDYKKYNIVFKKTDITGTNEVANADLKITGREKGKSTDITAITWTSDAKGTGKTIPLRPGDYILEETAAPTGSNYAAITEVKFTVDEEGKINITQQTTSGDVVYNNGVMTIMDDYKGTEVIISKVDILGNEIDGAKLELTGTQSGTNKAVGPITWESKAGVVKKFNLQPGSYKLHETSAPNGYKVITDVTFDIDGAGNVTVTSTSTSGNAVFANGKLTVTDEYEPTTVTFKKRDIVGSAEVVGADLKITGQEKGASSNIPVITWQSKAGKDEQFDLKPGTYHLEETNVSGGYQVITKVDFEVEVGGTIKILTNTTTGDVEVNGTVVTIKDDYKPIDFYFKKTDITGTKEVDKADLEITGREVGKSQDINKIIWTSDTSKTGEKISLRPGTYTLKETATPNGYETVTEVKFTVDTTGKITVTNQMTSGQVEVVNNVVLVKDDNVKKTIYIRKTDITGTTEVADAILEVSGRETGKTKDITPISWKSDTSKTGKQIQLRPGVYTLKETAAPNGYVAVTAVQFTVDDTGKVTVQGTSTTGKVEVDANGRLVVMDDTTKVTIRKTDITGGTEIAGAKLELKDAGGKLVDSWTSAAGVSHVINGKLIAGATYQLTETQAPYGYAIAEKITFTVNKDGKVQIVTMKDDYAKKTFIIDLTNNKKKRLTGGKMIIKDQQGNVIYEWISDGKPKPVILKPGKYVLTEPDAPDGYKAADDIPFEVLQKPDGTLTILQEGKETDEVIMVDPQDKTVKKTSTRKTILKKTSKKSVADTGDYGNLTGWVALGLLSLAMMLGLFAERKRRF